MMPFDESISIGLTNLVKFRSFCISAPFLADRVKDSGENIVSTDDEWEKWGQKDPYYGVLTNEKFRGENLTNDAKAEFFKSGRVHVDHVIDVCEKHLDESFSPDRVLDFGCGVGRLVVPFAQSIKQVVGLDISESMLKEARANCDDHALNNVTLLTSDDQLSALTGTFDLIHSVIVLQHIPIHRGRQIFEQMLNRLAPNGIGAIQVAYAKRAFKATYGRPSMSRRAQKAAKNLLDQAIRKTPLSRLQNSDKDAIAADPEMQMNSYNLNELFFLIQSAGVKKTYLEFTDHGGELGAFLYFQKP